eukprot:CAMPEP_0114420456 /NCGR_PEP_ID=MMETSP0103-20121206/4567_1 /TAXON_ID=37642 ORGANISM="Paraphysomonas imperforata, Strain PA2" /NCGR_SAMPLE_ID=MMETSP0103 /ASSEMBLY_ACC=CAM_ASM_000201 /LENGTH=794 /DNA_ID=CAMNT_0001588937 /DNA_START=108 /DNA_END=2492 /DNA_ORIENTATION=-
MGTLVLTIFSLLLGVSAKKPNVIFYMPDDLSFYFKERPASSETPFELDPALMPNFYRIREEGTVFLDANVAGPKCAPSRFNVLTGRYCSKSIYARSQGATTNPANSTEERFAVTVPQCKIAGTDEMHNVQSVLSKEGYSTIHSGKWHLAPSDVADWHTSYASAEAAVRNTGFTDVGSVYIENMGSSVTNFTHNLEWMTATAMTNIDNALDNDKPFFLYFAPTAPHSPRVSTAINEFSGLDSPNGTLPEDPNIIAGMPQRSSIISRINAASVPTSERNSALGAVWCDDALGALLDHVESKGETNNTIVIVTMDHGMGAKDSLYDQGVRVALMVRGPTITANSTVDTPVSNIDILPTILEAVGIQNAPDFEVDGVSWWSTVDNTTEYDSAQILADRDCLISEIDTDRMIKCTNNMKYLNHWESTDIEDSLLSEYPSANITHQLYDLSSDPVEKTNEAEDSTYFSSFVSLSSQLTHHDVVTGVQACEACGDSARYVEHITDYVGYSKRTITTSGCPNHYSYCTGKKNAAGCAAKGNEGSQSQALDQDRLVYIPGEPVIATSPTDIECNMGAVAVSLNGVSIYGGAVDTSCDLVDVTDSTSEWTSFDFCSGHSQAAGDYHYHFLSTCLLTDALARTVSIDGHSPQLGWAYDGFPIYGPNGVGGIEMTHPANGTSCAPESTHCLDSCSGKKQEIPGLDKFKYRYYFTGPSSDLTSLPVSPLPDPDDYPFSIKCYAGCTFQDLVDGVCVAAESGVADGYQATAMPGYTEKFTGFSDTRLCGTGILPTKYCLEISYGMVHH